MSSLTNSTLTVDTLDCSGIKLRNNTGYLDEALTDAAALTHAKSVFKFSYTTDSAKGEYSSVTTKDGNGYPKFDGVGSDNNLRISYSRLSGVSGELTDDSSWDNGYTISSSNTGQKSPPDSIEFVTGYYPLKFQYNPDNNQESCSFVFYVGSRGGGDSNRGHAIMYAKASSSLNSGSDDNAHWPCIVCDGIHGYMGKINTSSDKRLKKNELPIMNAINSINKVNILEYDKLICKKTNTYNNEIGVIAQDLEETNDPLLLQCVCIPKDKEERYYVNYKCMFFIEIKALQELYQEITQDKTETMKTLELLEERINNL